MINTIRIKYSSKISGKKKLELICETAFIIQNYIKRLNSTESQNIKIYWETDKKAIVYTNNIKGKEAEMYTK